MRLSVTWVFGFSFVRKNERSALRDAKRRSSSPGRYSLWGSIVATLQVHSCKTFSFIRDRANKIETEQADDQMFEAARATFTRNWETRRPSRRRALCDMNRNAPERGARASEISEPYSGFIWCIIPHWMCHMPKLWLFFIIFLRSFGHCANRINVTKTLCRNHKKAKSDLFGSWKYHDDSS